MNATGILAKLPGQHEADRTVGILKRDREVRQGYLTVVVSRACSLDWATAQSVVINPESFPHPRPAAERLTPEVLNPADAGARWCSATMLQLLSPRPWR